MSRHSKKTDQNKAWNKRIGAAAAYKRNSRQPNDRRFLIICEGKNTEPLYFKAFPVLQAEVEAFGTGRSKTSLVDATIDYVARLPRDSEREVWLVFDMDHDPIKDSALQREDFNHAVSQAGRHGFRVAYSNDAFELWFVLHYQYLDAAMTRREYFELLGRRWGISYERGGKGHRFCATLYQRLLDDPLASQENAIRNAERLFRQSQHISPAEQNPCTTVYQLVAELNKYLKK